MPHRLCVIGVSLLWCTAATSPAANLAPPALNHEQVELYLQRKLESQERAIFISRGGQLAGMDSDSLISFERGGGVIMGEYGYAYHGYRGTYEVAADGSITLRLKGFPSTWPVMKLVADGTDHWLYPVGKAGLVMGGRGGATETSGMKPFWPFKLVKGTNQPDVTPIYAGGEVKLLVSPVLPTDFQWHNGPIEFRVDFDVSIKGEVKVSKYFTQQTESRQYAADDWRLPAATCAMEAMKKWQFYPFLADEKPVPTGGGWNFTITPVGVRAHWVIKDDIITVYDNMPRGTIRAARGR